MEGGQYIYWVEHGMALGYLIAWYLWLISLAEGTHIVAHLSWLYYRSENYRPLEKIGTFQPFIILALVPLFLVADLGRPERFFTMFYHWHWTSPVAYGVYIITFCMISYAIHSYYLFRPELILLSRSKGPFRRIYGPLLLGRKEQGGRMEIVERQRGRERFWAGVSLFFSFLGLIYLGILLASFKGRMMWHSAVMVFIFGGFAVTSGSAFLILLTHLKNLVVRPSPGALSQQARYLVEFGIILKYSLLAQTAVWLVFIVQLQYTGTGGRLASHVLLHGPRAFQFWFLQVGVGLSVPFFLMMRKALRERPWICYIASLSTLVGALTGVNNIFMGGQSLPLTHFRWEHLRPEPGKMVLGIVLMAVMFIAFLFTYKILPYENVENR